MIIHEKILLFKFIEYFLSGTLFYLYACKNSPCIYFLIKLANEYYKWTSLKTNLILNEKTFQIPASALPNVIKPSSFQWLHTDKQAVVSKYYQYDKDTDKYVIAVKKTAIPEADIELIMRSLVLTRKAVVWVDFGYNIGTEFGGRHPAIILKNLKDSLVVIPLSSQMPKTMDYNVKIASCGII